MNISLTFIFLIFFNFLLLTSCRVFQIDETQFDDTEGLIDLKSPCNDDNQINNTNNVYLYEINKKSNNLSVTSWVKMKVLPGCLYKQTKIKFEYFENEGFLQIDSSSNYEITSCVENKKSLWIHPPRSFEKYMELTAFPEIKSLENKRKTWKSGLLIGSGYEELDGLYVKSVYTFDGEKKVKFDNDSLLVSVYTAISTSKLGKTYSSFLFSNKVGFLEMKHNILDSIFIAISLRKIEL